MRRAAFLVIIGLGGAAILIALGIWQVQRLAWKQSVIADIQARIAADPVALPADPDPARDAYRPVAVTGVIDTNYLRVLVSQKEAGAGYRIITALSHPDGPILLDRGFIPADGTVPSAPRDPVPQTYIGNLQWPQETDSFTPAPDLAGNIWFARDVVAMAAVLGTRPILLVQRAPPATDQLLEPMPVDTARIPNDHLQYAITWFSLAAIWLAMSFYFVRRRAPVSKG
ncbi:MAG: SURF1 family protein [Sulfitobacter sp.]